MYIHTTAFKGLRPSRSISISILGNVRLKSVSITVVHSVSQTLRNEKLDGMDTIWEPNDEDNGENLFVNKTFVSICNMLSSYVFIFSFFIQDSVYSVITIASYA